MSEQLSRPAELGQDRREPDMPGACGAAPSPLTCCRGLFLSLALAALALACYWPARSNDFVVFDDKTYLYGNPHIQAGMTWGGLLWAFTTSYAGNWHPLTWLSHMLDWQLFGANAGGHHLTSLLLHAINTVLLFVVFRRMTGAFWRSALVAALFACHPLHVESVAWASERKDLLSTFFFLLALGAYARYALAVTDPASSAVPRTGQSQTPGNVSAPARVVVTRPALAPNCTRLHRLAQNCTVLHKFASICRDLRPFAQIRVNLQRFASICTNLHGIALRQRFILCCSPPPKHLVQPSADSPTCGRSVSAAGRRYYLLTLMFFGLGLLAKPMVVTLPCVLVLLDVWPLKRLSLASGPWMRGTRWWPLLVEKGPFFALALASCCVTFCVQNAGGAVSSLDRISLGARLENAVVAYAKYVGKVIWPTDLAVFYPLPDRWPLLLVAGCLLLLLVLTSLCLRGASRYPYLTVGWCWFLGTLIPTIGLVQVGSQSMADRYMYIPSIGLFVIAAWGGGDLQRTLSRVRWLLPAAATGVVIACAARTPMQVACWHDEETLFRQALKAVPDNYLALDHLAKVCESSGRQEEAISYFVALLELKPRYPEGHYNLGTLLMNKGKFDEAGLHFQAALASRPHFAQAHRNLGIVRFRQGRLPEAAAALEQALELSPADADGYLNLGIVELALNCPDKAAAAFQLALRFKPDLAEAQFLLALARSRAQRPAEALVEATKARQLAVATGRSDLVGRAEELLQLCRSAQ